MSGRDIAAAQDETWSLPQRRNGAVDFGFGVAAVNAEDGGSVEGGWDFRAGYDKKISEGWNVGGQLHLINGWTEDKTKAT